MGRAAAMSTSVREDTVQPSKEIIADRDLAGRPLNIVLGMVAWHVKSLDSHGNPKVTPRAREFY